MRRITHPPPTRRRRSLIDFSESQIGDVATRDVAGGNIYNGVSPEHIVALMHEVIGDQRQYRLLEQMERESRRETLDHELAELRESIDHIARDIGQYREIGISADAAVLGRLRRRLARHTTALSLLAVAVGVLALTVGWLLAVHMQIALRPVVGGVAALGIARIWRGI